MLVLSPGCELLRARASSFLECEDLLDEWFGRVPGCCLSNPREGGILHGLESIRI